MRHPISRFLRLIAAIAVLAAPALTSASTGRYLARIPAKSPVQVGQLVERNIEILSISRDNVIDALVDDKQARFLLSQGYPVSIVPSTDIARTAAELDADLGLYHTFAEMESLVTAWETGYPAICDVFTIGTSVESRPIYAIKISDNASIDETGETEVLFMGNHHARELMSVEIPLLFAEYLLVNYGTDPVVTDHVNSKEIFFVPVVNPDGHVYVQNNHGGFWGNWWRKNRRVNSDASVGVDLNRNYGFAWGWDDAGSDPTPSSELYRGAYAFSEPETQAIRDFANSREFTMWLSYHSYGELLIYPWGYIEENTPDHRVFRELGERLTAANGYRAGNSASDILYIVNGDSDDWGYGEQATKNKIFAFTPEVNTYEEGGFGPPDSLIAPTFDLNFEMNMRVLEYSDDPYGVVGPYRPDMYAVADPYHPIHTVNWSANKPGDHNPAVQYEVERCFNPSDTQDECEGYSADWIFDGFTVGTDAYSGSHSYYSGMGDNLEHTITAARPYTVDAATDTFTFWASYAIETDWDYAYVETSADFGETWETVQGNITTTYDPYGNNRGHGITGTAPGWVPAIFPLTAYLGQEIMLRISYVTDAAVMEHGIDIDVIFPVPTCQSVDIVASGVADTTLLVVPEQTGVYRYRVQGYDAQNDASGWSGSAGITISSVTDAPAAPSYPSRLGPNYPNPFNPSTTIPYSVAGETGDRTVRHVILRVYDVTGGLVATLVDDHRPPGQYEFTWRSAGAASGLYFCRLTVDGRTVRTRKMVLLK